MKQVVPDFEFNDSAAWNFVGSGASITEGQLRFINANVGASQTIPVINPVIGETYLYTIDVESYPSPITARVLFGGVVIYNKDGAGVHTGTVIPINSGGLVFQATLAGQWFLNRVSIMAGGGVSLYDTLSGYAGLQAYIGNGDSPITSRVYPMLMPQDSTLPAVVYQNVVGTRVTTMTDSGGTGVERNLYQIIAWATTYTEANTVIEQVRLALKAAGIHYVPQSNSDIYEEETKLFGVRYDFAQWYR